MVNEALADEKAQVKERALSVTRSMEHFVCRAATGPALRDPVIALATVEAFGMLLDHYRRQSPEAWK